MFKRIICAVLCAVLLAAVFVGCAANRPAEKQDGKLNIVCTVYPVCDWVMNVLGENADGADVTMLLDSGADLHSYQPTADDMIRISTCDVFVYVGGESDGWVDDALANATNKEMQQVNLMQALGDSVKEEELVEGMQGEEEEEEEEGEEEVEYDEHVWLSLKNAQRAVEAITAAVSAADAENQSAYKANADAYNQKLAALDKEYQAAVDAAKTKTLLFADRFPFRYLTDDYGLQYYAAFVGCSAETEASFETVTFLAGKVDELQLKHVMVIENSDQKIAKTVIENTKSKNATVLALDSMQHVTQKDGNSYLVVMQSNLDVLKEALN